MIKGTRLGYACVNAGLTNRPKKLGGRVTTSRTLRKSTWQLDTGWDYEAVGVKALDNATDLLHYLKWNKEHGITLFRIGSELIPWHDHYELKMLPQLDEIKAALFEAGEYARKHNMRVTTHPGPFTVLGSPTPTVVDKSIIGLERHSEMFDMMGFEPSFDNKINIHIGGAYGDHAATAVRWIAAWHRLSDSCKKRLVVENDDKANMWSVQMLYDYFHKEIGIPITFDYFHHKFHTSELTEEQALKLAATTWPDDIRQCTHYSESKREEELRAFNRMCKANSINPNKIDDWPTLLEMKKKVDKIRATAHADYVIEEINTYGLDIDIVLEVKAKELALFGCRQVNKQLIK